MRREITKYLTIFLVYFIFITVANRLFSFSYWLIYLGGLSGLIMVNIDHLLHVFVFKPQELTSLRIQTLVKDKLYKEALVLLYDTREERDGLIFHTFLFQVIFAILAFWVVTSSSSLFAKGLVLSYFLSFVLLNVKKFMKGQIIFEDQDKSRIFLAIQISLLFIFGMLF